MKSFGDELDKHNSERRRDTHHVYQLDRVVAVFLMKVTIRGLAYHVEDSGTGDPLVMLHGFTGSARTWQPFVKALSRHFRVIRVDLPGHGQTATSTHPPDYHFPFVVRNLVELLDELDATPAHLLGYSMGGRVALAVACLPDRNRFLQSVILESASPGLREENARAYRRKTDNALADRIEAYGIQDFVNHWESLPLWESQQSLPDSTRRSLREERLQNDPSGLANSLRGMGTGMQPSLWNILHFLDKPVLLIAGEQDNKFVTIAEGMYLRIRTSELALIPDAGHTVHLEKPDLFIQQVLDFLTGVRESSVI